MFHNPQSSCSAHDDGHLTMIGTVLCQVTALRRSGSGHYRTSCQSLTMVSSVTRTLYKRNTFTSGCWNGSTFHCVSFRTKCWHLFTDSQRYLFMSLHHHTTTVLRPFFLDHPGEPVPEENFWTLWCKGRFNRGRRTDHPAGHHSIRTNQCPSPLSSMFLTGRMPFLSPSQQCQTTEGN